MTAEETREERIRRASLKCINQQCGSMVQIGPNYPDGVPLPKTLELYCARCEVISHHYNPMFDKVKE